MKAGQVSNRGQACAGRARLVSVAPLDSRGGLLRLPNMARTRSPVIALVALLLLSSAAPAFAVGEESRLSATQAKRVALAAKVNALKASDDQLEGAVKVLDAGVSAQAGTQAAAAAAERAAQVQVGSAEARKIATENRMADLNSKLAGAALQAYVHPASNGLLEIVRAKDLGEASRRQALLAHVANGNRSVLESMRAARADQQSETARLSAAKALAADRTRTATQKLTDLRKVQTDQRRLKAALDSRIASFTAEADAASKEEARLNAIIKSRIQGGSGAGPVGRISGSGFAWPAKGTITSPFGQRWGRMHSGIDIASAYGTPIKAAKAGRVILAGSNGGYGLAIVIDNGGGMTTMYAHMSRLRVSEGTSVQPGQQIGDMGSTGNSTGNHLHFEVRTSGTAQNPRRYLP